MTESKDTKLLWVDLETTGLDPKHDVILEIAAVVTDAELNELARRQWLVHPGDHQTISIFCAKMHARSGLLQDIDGLGPDAFCKTEDIEQRVCEFIRGAGAEGATLAGSTIAFDRSFLAEHMSSVLKLLHYRSFDVSTLKAAYRMWVGEIESLPDDKKPHRAMADVLASIDEARFMMGWYEAAKLSIPPPFVVPTVEEIREAKALRALDAARARDAENLAAEKARVLAQKNEIQITLHQKNDADELSPMEDAIANANLDELREEFARDHINRG